MIVALIVAYIANVFLNRWLNYLLSKKIGNCAIPLFWFLSLLGTIALICALLYHSKIFDWFTGKHW